ncbi:MAG: hypothetical protein GY938_17840 [Ketobacter sp.]|nr:hypothetical protein [Ketobacter sp.]
MMLTAEQILKADDRAELVKVDVPEWGGSVNVCVMSGSCRDRWELATAGAVDRPGTANIRASLCAYTTCDEKGKRLFSDGQIAALGEKSSAALDRVFSVARKLNKISDDDIEELEKN